MAARKCFSEKELIAGLKSNDLSIVYKCLVNIKTFSKNVQKMDHLTKLGAMRLIVPYLEHPTMCVISLSIVADCCLDTRLCDIVIDNDAVLPLVRLIRNFPNDDIVSRACRAIGNIAISNRGLTVIHKHCPVTAILKILASTDNIISIQTSLRALRILNRDSKTHNHIIVSENAFVIVSKFLTSDDVNIQLCAVKTMATLTQVVHVALVSQINKSQMIELLHKLYYNSDTNISEYSLTCLSNLTKYPEFVSKSTLEIFIHAAKNNKNDKTSKCAILCLCFCSRIFSACYYITSLGGIPILLDALQNKKFEFMHKNILLALAILCTRLKKITVFQELHIVPILMDRLNSFNKANIKIHSQKEGISSCQDNSSSKDEKNNVEKNTDEMCIKSFLPDSSEVSISGVQSDSCLRSKCLPSNCSQNSYYCNSHNSIGTLESSVDVPKNSSDVNNNCKINKRKKDQFDNPSSKCLRVGVYSTRGIHQGVGKHSSKMQKKLSMKSCLHIPPIKNTESHNIMGKSEHVLQSKDLGFKKKCSSNENERFPSSIESQVHKPSEYILEYIKRLMIDCERPCVKAYSDKTSNTYYLPEDHLLFITIWHILNLIQNHSSLKLLSDFKFSVIIDYIMIAPCPNPKAVELLYILISNNIFFELLIFKDFYGYIDKILNPIHLQKSCSSCDKLRTVKENLITCGRKIAQSPFCIGVLQHILCTSNCDHKLNCLYATSKLLIDKRLLYKVLIESNGLLNVFEFLKADEINIFEKSAFVLSTLSTVIFKKLTHDSKLSDTSSDCCQYKSSTYDVEFIFDDGSKVLGVKSVLIDNSEYFKSLLDGNYIESSQKCIALPCISGNVFMILMHLLHGCKENSCFVVKKMNLLESASVLEACERFLLFSLKSYVEKLMMLNMCMNHAALIYRQVQLHSPEFSRTILIYVLQQGSFDLRAYFTCLQTLLHANEENMIYQIRQLMSDALISLE